MKSERDLLINIHRFNDFYVIPHRRFLNYKFPLRNGQNSNFITRQRTYAYCQPRFRNEYD